MLKKTLLGVTALGLTIPAFADTPYDLIRPVYPLTWDAAAFDQFDVSVTQKTGMLPAEKTPESYKANAFIPESLDQAYLDALNSHISPIRVNQAGYLSTDSERRFYFVGAATEFEVVDADGKSLSPAVTGKFTSSSAKTLSSWTIVAGTDATTLDNKRYKVDFTGPSGDVQIGNIPQGVPTDKRLRIKVGNEISSTFIVSDDTYSMVRDAILKFYGIQRSGNSESWFHAPSHTKDGSANFVDEVNGGDVSGLTSQEGALQGGWYDCGDHLKESQTMSYAFMVAAVMAATNPEKDSDRYAYNHSETVKTDGIPDVLREAKHGADFFISSYKLANGVIDNMAVSVGDFGADHGYWGLPEDQDAITTARRGGASERALRLGELGSNISGMIAAGLALLSKEYAAFDPEYAKNCLKIAEEMYDFAKSLAQGKSSYGDGKPFKYNLKPAGWGTPAYNGNNEFYDDLALASVALLYATEKKQYADDMIRDKKLFEGQQSKKVTGCFEGGWFMSPECGLFKNRKNTSWANAHAYALYALYKLILADKEKSTKIYGLTEEEWQNTVENSIADMISNLSSVFTSGAGMSSFQFFKGESDGVLSNVSYDPIWFSMYTDQDWTYNRYAAGNIFELLAYAEVAADIEKKKISLPNFGTTSLNAPEMRKLGVNLLNYLLGMNPWDVSFVYGVGDKNDAHPHHRAANPEGRNLGKEYKYRVPVGGLFGGMVPYATNSISPSMMSWEDYHLSETCLDASATMLAATTLVANPARASSTTKINGQKVNRKVDASVSLAGQNLQIYASGRSQKMVQIFDLLGNSVYKNRFESENLNVPLNAIRHKGALQVRVTSGNKLAAVKSIFVK